MTSTLSDGTAIAIGCIIGTVVVILFGLVLWYCAKKKRLQKQQENTHYKHVIDNDSDIDTELKTHKNKNDTNQHDANRTESVCLLSETQIKAQIDILVDVEEKEEKKVTEINHNCNLTILKSDAVGHFYHDTKTFDDKTYLKMQDINLRRLHLHKIIYWKTKRALDGIQCEWNLYNDEGQIIQTFASEKHCKHNNNCDEYFLEFGDFWHDPLTISAANYVHSLSMKGATKYDNDKQIPVKYVAEAESYGDHDGIENKMNISSNHVVIGFHGGFSANLHHLGVITVSYKDSGAYDLIKCFFERYTDLYTETIVIECILDYIFFIRDTNDTNDIQIIHPRHDRRATVFAQNDYDDKQAINDAKVLLNAIQENKSEIVLDLTRKRSQTQRMMIVGAYNESDNRDLLHDLQSISSCIKICYEDLGEYDARLVIDGNKEFWIESICISNNEDMRLMKKAWNKIVTDPIHVFTNGESETFKALICILLDAKRFQTHENISIGEIRHYLNVCTCFNKIQLFEILSKWSWNYINVLNSEYIQEYDTNLADLVKKLFKNDVDLCNALCFIAEFSSAPYDYWARKIKSALNGIGINDDLLVRCIVKRSEIDLFNIRKVFDDKYGDELTLKQWIQEEIPGIAQKLLLMLCGYQDIIESDDEKDTKYIDEQANINIHVVESDDTANDIYNIKEDEDDDIEEVVEDIDEYKDIAAERIDNLLKMALPKEDYPITKYIGDRSAYKLPKKKKKLMRLERDLRCIRLGLKSIDVDDRKYCKLVMLRYFEILSSTFKRYCIFGCDRDWLSRDGWIHFIKDAFVDDRKSEDCTYKKCKELFEIIADEHYEMKHRMHKNSGWNGIWQNNENGETFTIKQISDHKLKGFVSSFDYCEIEGVIQNTGNKTCKLTIFYYDGSNKDKRMKCSAVLVEENIHRICINFECENRQEKGSFIMNKIGELTGNNHDSFKPFYGLLRHEFFDAILVLSQRKFTILATHSYKMQSFCKFIEDFIIQFIWDDIHSMNESKDAFSWKLKQYSQALHDLFTMYTTNMNMTQKQWLLLWNDVLKCACAQNKNAFENGGIPTKMDKIQSYQLAKNNHDEFTFHEFEKGLTNLAHKIYKTKPKSKYGKIDYQEKLTKLLEWTQQLLVKKTQTK